MIVKIDRVATDAVRINMRTAERNRRWYLEPDGSLSIEVSDSDASTIAEEINEAINEGVIK